MSGEGAITLGRHMARLGRNQDPKRQLIQLHPGRHLDALGLLFPQPFLHDMRAWTGNEVMTGGIRIRLVSPEWPGLVSAPWTPFSGSPFSTRTR
jgi:hypothetical protein